MPTKNNNPSGGGRRKRPPSHQNKFAFRHNPKSKLTDKILASPNVGCCQRCYDKIEWRKKYRKYKPRTQPGTCNGCRKRNVKAAYHTVCAKCSWDLSTLTVRDSSKEEEEGDGDGKDDVPVTSIGDGGGVIVVDAGQRMEEEENVADGPTTTNDVDPSSISSSSVAANKKEGKTEEEAKKNMRKIRMCAVCTKEPALGAKAERGDDEGDDTTTSYGPRLKLRERRALERQQQKEMEEKDRSKKQRKKDGGNGGESADEEDVLDDAESMEE